VSEQPSHHSSEAVPQKEALLSHTLGDYVKDLSQFHSTRRLKQSLIYKSLQSEIERILGGMEYGFYAPLLPYEKKPFYRAVAWNIQRGLYLDDLIPLLQNHPELSKADVLYLTETDLGMVRTQNRNIAQEIAQALKMNYFFVPSYIHLCGENHLGLHGNALLSRYPLENFRAIPLENCRDKMRGLDKRIGHQNVLVADIALPFRKMCAVVAHLDAFSSQSQRANQMGSILKALEDNRHPVLIGGDWNTSTYNTRNPFLTLFSFLNKLIYGVEKMQEDHYPYPERRFDKKIFQVLEKFGMEVAHFNETGVGTLYYHEDDFEKHHLLQKVAPQWMHPIAEKLENLFGRHEGGVCLKLDWFAGKWLKPAPLDLPGVLPPKVLSHLSAGGRRLSDHDPILVDMDVYG
jgi:endonuclease/exonuclease/phosphatase family metal-dependent hydrolase